MRKLNVFNNVSLDGYFTDERGDMSWAHNQDREWTDWVASNAQGDSELLFGRVTYEMMASFWPTPMAMEQAPLVAKHHLGTGARHRQHPLSRHGWAGPGHPRLLALT